MPRGRDDGLGWNPDAVEPMEPTEPTEPMELTEPMEPMEPAEPMEEVEQEEEMEPRRKEIKIHRVGMGKGYGSSASSAAEGSGSAPSYMPPKPKKKPERPVVEGRDYIPLEGGEPDGPVEIGSPSSSSPETTMVYQEAPPTPRREPRTLSSGHIALELQEQQVSAEQRRRRQLERLSALSAEAERIQRRARERALQEPVRFPKSGGPPPPPAGPEPEQAPECPPPGQERAPECPPPDPMPCGTKLPLHTLDGEPSNAAVAEHIRRNEEEYAARRAGAIPSGDEARAGNPRNLLVELHTFGPGTASEAKAVEQRVPAETRGLGPYNPGRGLGPYNPGWKMRELNQGAVPEDHLRRNDLLEARRHLQSQRDHHRSEWEQRKPLRSTRILLGGEQKGEECEKGARSQTLEVRKMNGEIGQDNEVDYQKEKAEIDYQEEKTEIDYQEESKFYGLCTNKSLYSDKTMNGTRDPLVMWIWKSIPGAKNLYDPKTMQFDYNGAMAMMLMLGVSGAIMLCIGCLQATVHLQSCRQSCLWRLQHSCFRRRLSRGARRDHLRSCACVRKQQRGAMLCVLVVLQFSAVQGMQQNGPPQQPTELSEILTALTRATQVGMSALQRLEQQASSSDDLNRRIESATKAIKAPDVWNPQASGEHPPDFTTWKHQFLNWLGFADSQYSEALSMIESLGATPIDVSTLTTVERELSTKLYHILTSYMRGAATQLSRNWSRERCGYRLYQSLLWEYQPATKQRALTLSQAIGMFPNFDGAKSMVEQIGSLENLVREYEIASGKTYDRDLLMGVLLRCSPRAIRDHLTLTMPEGTNYMSVKQAILSYEQSSKTWDYQTVLKQKTLQNTASSSNADQGPAPMEVDAVYEKGGGKGNKGNKGNKGGKGSYSWSSFGAGFRQWRKGKERTRQRFPQRRKERRKERWKAWQRRKERWRKEVGQRCLPILQAARTLGKRVSKPQCSRSAGERGQHRGTPLDSRVCYSVAECEPIQDKESEEH